MQVEIADSLYEKCQRPISTLHLAADVSSRVQYLIEDELLRWGGGYETDRFTRCKARDRLFKDIRRATSEGGATYRSDFVCLDIDDFKTYLDTEGLAPGDKVLQDIGKQPRDLFRRECLPLRRR